MKEGVHQQILVVVGVKVGGRGPVQEEHEPAQSGCQPPDEQAESGQARCDPAFSKRDGKEETKRQQPQEHCGNRDLVGWGDRLDGGPLSLHDNALSCNQGVAVGAYTDLVQIRRQHRGKELLVPSGDRLVDGRPQGINDDRPRNRKSFQGIQCPVPVSAPGRFPIVLFF